MNVDAEIDVIFARIDDDFSAGEFGAVDRELRGLSVRDCSTTILIAYLTITSAGHAKLKERAGFLERVRAELCTRPADVGRIDRLLEGL